jgi:MFS family permease
MLEAGFTQGSESFAGDYIALFALAAGASTGDIALLAAAANLATAGGFLPGAALSARLRSRKTAILPASNVPARFMLPLLAALPLLVPAGRPLVILIIALNAVRLFGGSLGNAAWTSFVADLVPPTHRGRLLGGRNLAIGAMALAASPLAGWLISSLDARAAGSLTGYQVSLLASFGFAMVAVLLFSRIPEPPARTPTLRRARRGAGQGGLKGLLRRNPPFLWFTAATFVWSTFTNVSGPFVNVFMVKGLGGNAASVGAIAGAYALTGLLGQAVFGRLSDRRGNRALFIATGFIIPILPCLWAAAQRPGQGIPINLVSGFFWAGYGLAAFNLLLELCPSEDRERAFGLYQTVAAVGAVIGPLVGGWIVDAVGFRPVFLVSGAGRWAAMIMFAALVRAPRPQAPAEPKIL